MIKYSDGYPLALALSTSAGLAAFAAQGNYSWSTLIGDMIFFAIPLFMIITFMMCLVNCLYQLKRTGIHKDTIRKIRHPLIIMIVLLCAAGFYGWGETRTNSANPILAGIPVTRP